MPDEQTEKFAAIAIERPGLRRRFSSVGKDDWFYSVPVRIHAVVGNGTLKGAKADPAGCPSPPSPAPTKGSMCAVVSAKNPSGITGHAITLAGELGPWHVWRQRFGMPAANPGFPTDGRIARGTTFFFSPFPRFSLPLSNSRILKLPEASLSG
jgi:hypothetical protein